MTSYTGLTLLLAEADFSIFEFGMLLCFGICWPVSIYKLVKSKRTEGKSLLFVVIVWFGYLSGLVHKIWFNYDLVIILYICNLIFVFVDILLHIKYSRHSMETLKVPFTLR
jgi:hypothetical protein